MQAISSFVPFLHFSPDILWNVKFRHVSYLSEGYFVYILYQILYLIYFTWELEILWKGRQNLKWTNFRTEWCPMARRVWWAARWSLRRLTGRTPGSTSAGTWGTTSPTPTNMSMFYVSISSQLLRLVFSLILITLSCVVFV